MITPKGMEFSASDVGTCVYVGIATEGGGVNVGRRVLVGRILNCAANVGSIVDVAGGTGVGGGSTICSAPGETCTNGE